jgi:tetratricopeptide (TPR) repeat protein
MMYAPASLPFSNRRYRLLKQIGTGGMGRVYRAYDRLTQQIVAIKRIHLTPQRIYAEEGVALRKLAHEFTILAGLHHPNIIHVRGYGFENQQQPFLVMDYLEDAVDIITATKFVEFNQKVELFVQLLQALVYLHRHQIIHRDLKPANVLVTVDQEIRLVDFGLASGISPQAEVAIGSLAYMSPEAVQHQPVGIPADLNAVGVLAYECFTGVHPYMTSSVARTMSNIINAEPDVERLLEAIQGNHALAKVILFLLRKKPSERYDSAQRVLEDLCQAVNRPLPEETQMIRESYLQSALFIGREQELGILSEALNVTKQGDGSAWLLGGESGVGKSRLLEQVRIQALIDGFTVVRGTALQDGSLTYQLWRGIVPHLLLEDLSIRPEDLALLREIVPNIDLLLDVTLDAPRVDLHASILESLIVEMFRRREQPILVLLEDVQWAHDQWGILRNIMEASRGLPVMFLATFRTDDVYDLPQQIPFANPIYLNRFSIAEIEHLITSILGYRDFVPKLVAMLQRETDGNAFYLLDILRTLSEHAGGLEYITEDMIDNENIVSPTIQEMVQRRLDLLPFDHLPMLRLAALAGRQLDFNIMRYVDNEMDYDRWLSDCTEASILEYDSGEWRFVHDKIRQGMLYRIDPLVKVKLHRMIAEAIEAVYWNQSGYELRLAEQWRDAGDFDREMQYLLLHMEWLLNIRSFSEIIAHLQPYLTRFESIDHPSLDVYRAEVLLMLGRAEIGLNNIESGLADVDASRELGSDLEHFALCIGCDLVKARVQLYQADYPAAEATLRAGFEAVARIQAPRLQAELSCLKALLLSQTQSREAAEDCLDEAEQFYYEVQDYNGLAEVANIHGQIAANADDIEEAIQAFEEVRRLYLESQNFVEVVRPLNNLGIMMTRIRRYGQAVEYLTQALEGARRYANMSIVSSSLRNLGRAYVEMNEPERALKTFTELLPLLKSPGHERWSFIVSLEMALIYLQLNHTDYSQVMVEQARALIPDPAEDILLSWVVWYGANVALEQDHLMQSISMTGCLLYHFENIDPALQNCVMDFRHKLEEKGGEAFVATALARISYPLEDCARLVFDTHLPADVS